MYIPRKLETQISKYCQIFPVVAILGPRQCGKSTLVKQLFQHQKNTIYLDLQNIEDLNKLSDPRLFFKSHEDKTICLDEIQLMPDLFSALRSVVDENRRNGRFILLGSASRTLVQHSSESLAGRIGFLYLTPFLISELPSTNINDFWNRGGFPESVLALNDEFSYIWRENLVMTHLERDIPQLGYQISPMQLRRFLSICAYNQGQTINLTKIAGALDCTHPTIRKYTDLLEQTFILRSLPPLESNTKKRMIKSPKVYVRDCGLLHALLSIKNLNILFGHPVFGASWEGMAIEQILSTFNAEAYFYRSVKGDELDLILELNGKLVAIECKASSAPQLTKSNLNAISDVQPYHTFIVAPINSAPFPVSNQVTVINLRDLLTTLMEMST